MKLTWMAHSCFNIILENGTKIVFDPFDNTIGYELPVLEADIALISHDHFDHNDVSRLSGDYTLIREAGEYTVGDVKIRGIKTYHDPEQGALRGENIVFIVEAEGIRIAHLGDLGEMPSEEFYKELGKIDILLTPVGSVYTINGAQAYQICRKIDPNIIIPMHYKTLSLTTPLESVQKFLIEAVGYYDISRLGNDTMKLEASNLKKRTRVIVMQPKLD